MSYKLKIRPEYGVYLCSHVFKKESPILEVVRDPDECWQFYCGEEHDFENEEGHLVGIGHLIEGEPSIQDLASMEIGTYAERKKVGEEWQFGLLDE